MITNVAANPSVISALVKKNVLAYFFTFSVFQLFIITVICVSCYFASYK